jgi:hypothetical protein
MDLHELLKLLVLQLADDETLQRVVSDEVGEYRLLPVVVAETKHRQYEVTGVHKKEDGEVVVDLEFLD